MAIRRLDLLSQVARCYMSGERRCRRLMCIRHSASEPFELGSHHFVVLLEAALELSPSRNSFFGQCPLEPLKFAGKGIGDQRDRRG